jgi:putative phosphoesterase
VEAKRSVRIAIVSDIHGNRTAFEAVLADLQETSPDLVLHGGDLADSGSSPAEIVDRIRDLGWNGVLGNTDEMHSRPESLEEFVNRSAAPSSLWAAVRDMAAATHAMLGDERIAWLRTLPRTLTHESIALVHASPGSTWQSPGPDSSDEELDAAYGPLSRPIVVYGHIHRSFVRTIRHSQTQEVLIVNSGSVSLPYTATRVLHTSYWKTQNQQLGVWNTIWKKNLGLLLNLAFLAWTGLRKCSAADLRSCHERSSLQNMPVGFSQNPPSSRTSIHRRIRG